ncbi:MAG TPA: nucleoside triphosphate pyrophosphohydrolase family protein [Bryobacteraceae bacterium]|nr:nucleoside triphosphate pyrophosphohydrolase family protein [Bryobacteraceae bacterium]
MTKDTHRSILLADYISQVEPTDRLPNEDLQPVLLGLFGEVGSIMATAKKFHREKEAYAGYRHAVEEEFGDALWYFTALCRRLGIRMDEVLSDAATGNDYSTLIAANDLIDGPISRIATPLAVPELDPALLALGEATSNLFALRQSTGESKARLTAFAKSYLEALKAARVTFAEVVRMNIAKTRGRFAPPDLAALPTFDDKFQEDQRLPQKFKITIDQRNNVARSYLRWNGVFIGDPLTDNIRDPDGYRFHDVFHFAHAAILHWSPTFRALIKHKRKDDPKVDEAEDGGRAVVVEEGLTAWIFSRAKGMNFFEGQNSISFDLLKTVQQFVAGYEVEACPLSLWEIAILRGYDVFRQIKKNSGGIVVCDRSARTVEYEPLGGGDK